VEAAGQRELSSARALPTSAERNAAMSEEKHQTEEYKLDGDEVIRKVKELIHEGNIRRLIIKNEDGKKLIEIPLTIGVVGAVLVPVWAAIGAVAAVVTSCTIEVERMEDAG
jgi:hypothetical protein